MKISFAIAFLIFFVLANLLLPAVEFENANQILAFALNSSHSQKGRLAFSAYYNENWDIYSVRADGFELRRVTNDSADDRSPAWSPDGTQLAFQSNREGNWDIYVISAGENTPRRLTYDPAYDGAPCWSPDGKQLAFESYREGDLDIFVMDADGNSQTNLTSTERAGDFDPAWSPDGTKLAFTSGRMGDNDIFIMDLSTEEVSQWTDSFMPEGNATWSHDGESLVYVQHQPDRREIYLGKSSQTLADGGRSQRLTWFGCDDSPALSPFGNQIAYIAHLHTNLDMEYLLLQELIGQNARELFSPPNVLLAGWEIVGPLSWSANDSPFGEVVENFVAVVPDFSPGLVEASKSNLDARHKFVDLSNVEAPNARLNAGLIEAFNSIREKIRMGAGYDFLAELSDMWRGADAHTEGSAYLSWHKAGRAFDTLFDYRDESNYPLMEVAREDIGGETFWRIFLKAANQDGSMGLPLKVQPWDLTGNARRKHPADGGTWKSIPYGYYVDITRIIRHGGWERISAIDRRDFSWRWHFFAIEYWHHQWRDDLEWYEAMEDVYPLERVQELYNWRDLVKQGESPYNLFNNGVPIPPAAAKWKNIRR